ncbi:MAG: NAD-dependent epimerase/dehydratase family protein [Myxococcota bacterium]|nr:NAD-dependent epimerase/dehydratase family protein [Myxococcota bacterium]
MTSTKQRTILITGASGFLGRHLIEELRGQEGVTLRALVRSPALYLEERGVEVVLGDVCNPEVCARAVEGAQQIYHVAGMVSRDAAHSASMYRLHVDGTRELLRAAAAVGSVERIVVVSTSGTVAVSPLRDEISDEESPYRIETVARWPYYLSKIYQERTAFQLARELGLNVVVVNPSLLLGPGDERGSSTGDVEKVVRGRLPVYPKGGGVAFVDARDAAAGCVLAMERGRSGERYLLSAANMTLAVFLGRVARLAEVPAPRELGGAAVLKVTTRLVESCCGKLDFEPPVDIHSVAMAEPTRYVDSSKAEEKLGWQCRDPQETLAETVGDVQRRYHLGRFGDSRDKRELRL